MGRVKERRRAVVPAVARRAPEIRERVRRFAPKDERQVRVALEDFRDLRHGVGRVAALVRSHVARHAAVDARDLHEIHVVEKVGQNHLLNLDRGIDHVEDRRVSGLEDGIFLQRREFPGREREIRRQRLDLLVRVGRPGGHRIEPGLEVVQRRGFRRCRIAAAFPESSATSSS
jgi:hypothetical protein